MQGASTFVWVAEHPSERLKLFTHRCRHVIEWRNPAWLLQRLELAGEPVPQPRGWHGAVQVAGLAELRPGHVIEALTDLVPEERLMFECPAPCSRALSVALCKSSCKQSRKYHGGV